MIGTPRIPALVWIVYLLMVAGLAGCTPEAPQEAGPPNVIWINVEDISQDLGCYGSTVAHTPHLDSLAAHSVVYDRAYATAPICSPSRSAFITGVYATSMGTQHLRSEVTIPATIQTLPQRLKQAGYWTSNYGKTDFNFSPEGSFDYWENNLAPWRNRPDTQAPFFSMFVIGMTHEGGSNHTEKWAAATKLLPKALLHNPDSVPLPPYYPDDPAIRTSWAHYHDNITVMDSVVGTILTHLQEDHLDQNTVIIFFADHGAGMPRYKRWLNVTGLNVPLIVYLPPGYTAYQSAAAGTHSQQLVSLVDLAPSTLALIGADIPAVIEGQPFLGKQIPPARQYVIGARSRADNMYEVSRCIITPQHIYIRHYLPHLPYIQPGKIFSDEKETFRALRALHQAHRLPPMAESMWHPKPLEELYDLTTDPHELTNLAGDATLQAVKDSLQQTLLQWMMATHDAGLVPEAGYMDQPDYATPYDYLHDTTAYPVAQVLAAAEQVGKGTVADFAAMLSDHRFAIRYWGVIGLQAMGEAGKTAMIPLQKLLEDEAPTVAIAAAQTLCQWGRCAPALPVLGRYLLDDRPWLALYAARSTELIGAAAKPLVPQLKAVIEKYKAPPGASLPYKDYNFAAFISWSAEYALMHCDAFDGASKPIL